MIGPLLRSPHRPPRPVARPSGTRRRARNLLIDLWEYILIPLGRWDRMALDIATVPVAIRGLPAAFRGYRIAFLSDLHASPLVPKWWLERAVGRANALEPDLIALGGDYVDDDPHFVPDAGAVLAALRARDGVVAVLGNHDHYVGAPAVREALHAAGVRELLNTNLILRRGEAQLAICGVGDLEMDAIDFEAAVRGVADDVPRVVLSHDPDVFHYWPETIRCDLMVSGHTHGGQAYLPVFGPPFVPSQFGARFLKGRYLNASGTRQLYVSRGIGASGVPFRWGCPPELTVVELTLA